MMRHIFCLLGFISICLGQIQVDDLITGMRCGASTRIVGGVVVSHQPIDELPPISNNITCFFTMQAFKFRQKIRFVFRHFALTPTDCSLSNLNIYDGQDDTATLIAQICPTDSIAGVEYSSTSFWLTLKLQVTYTAATPPTANFTGFYVSYTDDRDPCVEPANELMCGNGRCIYKELECDGYNSCGDGTDEGTGPPTNCNFTTPSTTSAVSSSSTTTPSATTTTTPATTTTTGRQRPRRPPPQNNDRNQMPNFPDVFNPDKTGSTTTPTTSTTVAPTTTTIAVDVVDRVIIDLTPLVIILTLTFAIFVAYLVYSLLSVPCFKAGMMSCLHHCCLSAIRRRRIWKERNETSNGRLRRKITPENRNTSMIIENLSTCDLQRNGKVNMDSKEAVYASSTIANGNGTATKHTDYLI